MIVYLLPIIFCTIASFSKEFVNDRRLIAVCGVLLCLFYCFGYMTGSDWRTYEALYNNLDFSHFYSGYTYEPGYYLYMYLAVKLHIPFWLFTIFTKCVMFFIVFKTIFDYCEESGFVALIFYLPWFGMYFFIDCPIRNCIAVAIFIVSTRYIIEGRFWKFLPLALLASTFHITALFVIFLYPFLRRDLSKWFYLAVFLAVNILFLKPELLTSIIVSVFSKLPYLNEKVVSYFLLDSEFVHGKLLSFGLLWQTALFVLAICYKERIIAQIGDKRGLMAFNCTMWYFILVRFSMTIPMFMRLQLYLSVFTTICIGLIVLSFDFKSRFLYVALLFTVASYTCYDKATGTARYVPYSNIIPYAVKGEQPSYSKRFFYNINNSPYTKDIDVSELNK